MRTTATRVRIGAHHPGVQEMADSHGAHGEADPNAAPMHHDIVETFSPGAVLFCYVLAALALISGVVAGLVFIND